jgi:hypothetical protein
VGRDSWCRVARSDCLAYHACCFSCSVGFCAQGLELLRA